MKKHKFLVIQGRKRKKTGEKAARILLGAAIAVFGFHILYSLVHHWVSARFVRTVLAEEGYLEEAVPVRGVFVRDEWIVTAPVTGRVRWLAEEGRRLAVGSAVAILALGENQAVTVVAPVPGVVVLRLDGLEGVLQPQALEEINVQETLLLPVKNRGFSEGELVEQGSALFKMVDNYRWYFVFDLPPEDYAGLAEGGSRLLRLSFGQGQEAEGVPVVEIFTEAGVTLVIEVKDYVEGCFTERFADARVVIKRTEGIVLPASALVRRGDVLGVFTLDRAVVRFREVDVLETGEEKMVVGGLRPGVQVIVNPGLVKEGQRL